MKVFQQSGRFADIRVLRKRMRWESRGFVLKVFDFLPATQCCPVSIQPQSFLHHWLTRISQYPSARSENRTSLCLMVRMCLDWCVGAHVLTSDVFFNYSPPYLLKHGLSDPEAH